MAQIAQAMWGGASAPPPAFRPAALAATLPDITWKRRAEARRQGRSPAPQFCLLFLLLPIAAPGVIVDRIAIAVGDKIITESEIDLRIRLTAFQNEEKPDFSLASRRRAAAQLIDQRLIEREMDLGHYPRLDPAARAALLANYEKTEDKLSAYGLTPQDLADDLGRQSDLLSFLNLRFRPAVQVTDEDIQKYFAEHVREGSLNEMRAQIEKKLTDERATRELDLWLRDQHRRTRIEYLEKDLESK